MEGVGELPRRWPEACNGISDKKEIGGGTMRKPFALLGAIGAVVLLSFPALVSAQGADPTPEQLEKTRQANAECFACHSPEGFQAPPKEGLDLGKLRGLLQHPDVFGQSDHRRLACTKCHNEGYDEHPHADDARDMTSTCTDCHSKKAKVIEPQFEQSVHAKHLADSFTCTTCHDPHLMRLAERQSDASRIVAQDNRVCLGCHDSDDRFAQFAPEKKLRPLLDDIHAWLPNARLHWRSVRCVDCHTPEVAAGEMISHEVVGRDRAQRDCVACHSTSSTLKTRLYRHLVAEEQQRLGFANSVLLANAYIPGATRHPLLDTLVLGAFAAMLLGLLAHGLGRFLTRGKRPRDAQPPDADPGPNGDRHD